MDIIPECVNSAVIVSLLYVHGKILNSRVYSHNRSPEQIIPSCLYFNCCVMSSLGPLEAEKEYYHNSSIRI